MLHRENDYLSPEKSFKAKLRMYTFMTIFVITGLVSEIHFVFCLFFFGPTEEQLLSSFYFLVTYLIFTLDFIVLCDAVDFLRREKKYIGAEITEAKHRQFTILLLLQVT